MKVDIDGLAESIKESIAGERTDELRFMVDEMARNLKERETECEKLKARVRILTEFDQHSKEMNAVFVWAIDKAREHFDDQWKLKGDGKWRIDELSKLFQEMHSAERAALEADNRTTGDV